MAYFRYVKLVFACWAVAVGIGILLIVLGIIVFGFESVDRVIDKYATFILIVLWVASFPVVNKFLK